MALNIPLPEAPPGGFYGGARAANQLARNFMENQFYPQSQQAEIASKLAYANLMGPQFLSKLMGHEDILANMTPEQRVQALQLVTNAGMGQGTGVNALSNQPSNQISPLSKIVNTVKNAFGFSQTTPSENIAQPQNILANQPNLSNIDKNAINNLQDGQSYIVQGNQPNQLSVTSQPSPEKNTFAENVGQYKGIKTEGTEAGKIRAKDINDLSDVYFNSQNKQVTLDNISKIISSPEFEQIRKTPILGHNELSYYARYGTPSQQNMVGQLMTTSGNIIKDSARDFAGQFRKGEQQLLENMKINPGDTVDVARGKMEQLSYLNKMLGERSRLTAAYMQKNHSSKLEAAEWADKQLNGDQIRNQIHNILNPKPTEKDIQYMAKIYKTTTEDIKKRLKAKGIF